MKTLLRVIFKIKTSIYMTHSKLILPKYVVRKLILIILNITYAYILLINMKKCILF